MPYLNLNQLKKKNFKKIGKNVKVSSNASIYDCGKIEIGDNSRIDDFCLISGKVSIGKNCHIAAFCNLAGGEKGIFINDFAGVAYNCQIFTQSDDYSGNTLTNPTIIDEFKDELKAKIIIKKHVIVGTKSVILPGVILETGCAIYTCSLVTKSTEPWSIYCGIPAKKIKNRSKNLLKLEMQYLNSLKKNIG
jgi:acetyltransferase-like isoleucine patch superfamily enzyme